jgi:penicillin-binding protein 2
VNPEGLRLRLTALGVIAITLFGSLFARLWYLQVLDAGQFRVAGQTNGVRLVYEAAPRGRILDRNGTVLVDNTMVEQLTVDRATVKKHPEVLGQLAALLSTPTKPRTVEDLKLALADQRFSPLEPVPVAEVNKDTVVYVQEHADAFPGVSVQEVAQRVYPNGTLAAHLLGYVGEINGNELATRKNGGYRLGDQIGKSGIELAYENVLRGQPGVTKLEVDSSGRVLSQLGHQDPVQGHDIKLTIDINVQRAAEDALNQGLALARNNVDRVGGRHFVAPAGAVVVLDPHDSSVIALASNPTYDPSQFVNGIPTALFQQYNDPSSHFPLNDRATSGLYAPGSTFKLVTGTAALNRGLINSSTTFPDPGFLKVGNAIFHNAGGASYGRLGITRAITVSSDVFFYNLGAAFWNDRRQYGLAIQDQAHEYGFGQRTGIPIGGEAAGRVPDPQSRKALHDQNPVAFPNGQWFTGDNVNLAVGQGELVTTPIQLANAYAAFANGGTLYQPRVATAVLNQDGTKVSDIPAHAVRQVAFPPATHDAMLGGFEGVVQSQGGTAYGSFAGFPLSRFPLAGKTGTAQVSNGKQDTSVFVGWGPTNDPRYLVTVFEEEAGFGASGSAPVARHILEFLAGVPQTPVVYIPVVEAGQTN